MKTLAILGLFCLCLTACATPITEISDTAEAERYLDNVTVVPEFIQPVGRIDHGKVYIVEAPNGEWCIVAAVYETWGAPVGISVDCTGGGSWLVGQDEG
jgi:hypothetical protein